MQETATEKKGTAARKAGTTGFVYWGYLQSKDVLDVNGKFVGVMRGFVIDGNWTIPKVVIEVGDNILDEMDIKRSLLETALVELPSEYVRNGIDVIQLTGDVDSLKGKANLYFLP